MMQKKNLKIGILTIMALAAAGAILYVLWLGGALLPGWALWEENSVFEASGKYQVTLSGRAVSVYCGEKEIWHSPEEVKVQQVISADLDRDEADELILLCWKRGRYGKHKPFWVEKFET